MNDEDLIPLHLGAWLLLLVGLAVRSEAAGEPLVDPFMQFVGWVLFAAGVLAVLATIGWELVRAAVRDP